MDRELLLELGLEELPASWLPTLTAALADTLRAALRDHQLPVADGVEAHATPRRLAVVVPALGDRQEDRDETLMGPPVSAAFGPDGKPTPAALGFARKQGVAFDALTQLDTPKGRYLAFAKTTRGRATVDVLPDVLTRVLRDLPFPKQMRWDAELRDGRGALPFGRPIRWLLFLYGGRVVPYTIARTPLAAGVRVQDVTSGAVTYGHRVLATSGRAGRAIKVRTFDEYKKKLAEHFVFLARIERKDRIVRELDGQARKLGGRMLLHQAPQAEALLDEVPDLVEYPGVVAGTFDAGFLSLPAEVLTTTLIHHQHFFPVVDGDGRLLPAFLAVTNTQGANTKAIAVNAARVVTARLRDARFFWDADRAVGLEGRLPRLETLVFHRALGSYRTKADRVSSLARWIAEDALGQPADVGTQAALAGRLAKADLATDMVREFTELQGVMGGIYARDAGLPEPVWRAIYHHYQPLGVEASAPPSRADLGEGSATWAAVSLADKLDTIAGLFHAGERPTGSRDPFGLRRAAHGVLRVLLDLDTLTGLTARPGLLRLLRQAVRGYDPASGAHVMTEEAWQETQAFLRERVEYVLTTRGADRRHVRAVLAGGIDRPMRDLEANVQALSSVAASEAFRQLATAFKRVRNIARDLPDDDPDGDDLRGKLTEPAELALLDEIEARGPVIAQALADGQGFVRAYEEAAGVEPAVARFFTDVFVMAEDPALRRARLRLMKRLERVVLQLGDISEIVAAE